VLWHFAENAPRVVIEENGEWREERGLDATDPIAVLPSDVEPESLREAILARNFHLVLGDLGPGPEFRTELAVSRVGRLRTSMQLLEIAQGLADGGAALVGVPSWLIEDPGARDVRSSLLSLGVVADLIDLRSLSERASYCLHFAKVDRRGEYRRVCFRRQAQRMKTLSHSSMKTSRMEWFGGGDSQRYCRVMVIGAFDRLLPSRASLLSRLERDLLIADQTTSTEEQGYRFLRYIEIGLLDIIRARLGEDPEKW
jgi:hypothetical protein